MNKIEITEEQTQQLLYELMVSAYESTNIIYKYNNKLKAYLSRVDNKDMPMIELLEKPYNTTVEIDSIQREVHKLHRIDALATMLYQKSKNL